MNKIVAHFQDGHLLKGFTTDFLPAKDHFHLVAQDQAAGAKPVDVRVADLKALFFVKTFEGNPAHRGRDAAVGKAAGAGRAIRVAFKDGEVMLGTTQGYDKSRPGFWLVPADPGSNNDRCFVVTAATQEVSFV